MLYKIDSIYGLSKKNKLGKEVLGTCKGKTQPTTSELRRMLTHCKREAGEISAGGEMISERRWHMSRNLQGEEQFPRQGMGEGHLRTEKGMDRQGQEMA